MSFPHVSFPIIQSLEVPMTKAARPFTESHCKLLVQGVAFPSAVLVQGFDLCVSITAALNWTGEFAGTRLNETYMAKLVI